MKGIQPELKPCSGNSTVSDFRLNKGTMFYFYPCLKKRRLTHQNAKVIISASHVFSKAMCMCVCERQRKRLSSSSSGKCIQEQHEELLSVACQTLTRALTPVLTPSLCPSPVGLPTSLPGEMSNSHSGTGAQHRLALWNGCSLWQINVLSIACALPLSDSQEEKEGEKRVWVERREMWFYVCLFACICVCVEGC